MTNRTFIPGSQWLYFKIYTGEQTADSLLVEKILPFINKLSDNRFITDFFYIRYTDPLFHLRLRLHLSNPDYYSNIFASFYDYFQPCINNGTIHKIMCDTYERELERYGYELITYIEKLFYIDSLSIIKLLNKLQEEDESIREHERWNLSLLLIDDILNVFGYNVNSKKEISNLLSENMKTEFGLMSHHYTKQFNDKYRIYKSNIWNTLIGKNIVLTNKYSEILNERKFKMNEVIEKIKSVQTNIVTTYMVISIIHMTMNRLFKSKNRIHELVLYFFLYRFYDSFIARI